MSDIETIRAAVQRAAELLDATRRFMLVNPIAAEYTVVYDEASCDGDCLAEDCRIAGDELACVAEVLARLDRNL